jgi:hypothetical protein
MKITIHNYEAYLVDLIDGNLSGPVLTELQQFINQHPELGRWEELSSGFDFLEPESVLFQGKDALKKQSISSVGPINESNFDEYFISSLENQLTKDEESVLAEFLQKNQVLKSEFEAFQQTRLIADQKIYFSDKEKLKQKSVFLPFVRPMSYAASILLLISMFVWWNFNDGLQVKERTEIIEVAQNIPEVIQQEPVNSIKDHSDQIQSVNSEQIEVVQPEAITSIDRRMNAELVYQPKPLQYTETAELSIEFGSGESDYLLFYFDGPAYLMALGEPQSHEKQSLAGLVLRNLTNKAGMALEDQKRLAGQKIYRFASEDKLSMWGLAELGVKSFNNLTSGGVNLDVNKGADGKYDGFTFKSDPLTIVKSKH